MKAIYLEDSYLRAFDAVVLSASGDRVILDKTAFYPASGGQPSDQGSLCKADEEFTVLSTMILDGQIEAYHRQRWLKSGDGVHAVLDWERRYRFMRSHTACHILSAVIFREISAKIIGNQIDCLAQGWTSAWRVLTRQR
jgi:misacylated tRNA(Ala) deacylase